MSLKVSKRLVTATGKPTKIKPGSRAYQSPRPIPFWKAFGSKLKEGVSVVRDDSGNRYMFIITSNSYKDREDETLTTRTLKEYVEKGWNGEQWTDIQPYYFWHDEELPEIGQIVWADMQGPFLIEVAKEAKNPFARKVWDYVETHPRERWGASHGFDYPESLKDDAGTYYQIYKFETSLLPLWAAANPYTLAVVLGGTKSNMPNQARDVALDKMLGRKGAAKKLRSVPSAMQQALERQGVAHKGMVDDQQSKVHNHIAKLTEDPDLQRKLHQTIAEHHAEKAASMSDHAEPDGDEWDGEDAEGDEWDGDYEDEMDDEPEDRRSDEKAQEGYQEIGKTGPGLTPDLVNSAITKKPGNYPPPVTAQETGKSNKELTRMVKSLVKDFDERLGSLEEAMAEIAELVSVQKANEGFAPRQASVSPETEVTDADLVKSVKQMNGRFDSFWNSNTGGN